jgi:hypothetical protein
MVIKYRFKHYPYIVATDKKELWQLEHFKKFRTCPKKKLTYNIKRKAFRINSQWVSRKRLLKFKYKVNEVLDDDIDYLTKCLVK